MRKVQCNSAYRLLREIWECARENFLRVASTAQSDRPLQATSELKRNIFAQKDLAIADGVVTAPERGRREGRGRSRAPQEAKGRRSSTRRYCHCVVAIHAAAAGRFPPV